MCLLAVECSVAHLRHSRGLTRLSVGARVFGIQRLCPHTELRFPMPSCAILLLMPRYAKRATTPCRASPPFTLIFHWSARLQESRERELSTTANLCVGLAASALVPLAPVIVFATAIVVAILRALYNVFCSCSSNGAPVAQDKGARAFPTGVSRSSTGGGGALQEPLIVVR